MRLRLTAALTLVAALAVAVAALAVAAPSADAASAVTAPTKVVKLGKQTVGYRSFGSGRPLVMIIGLAGTMDSWDPTFLDSLSGSHRIVLLDNEGIGKSSALSGRLTIRRMADNTARFMKALKLKRPDVAGWSMGGMIAQSLAIRHPGQIRDLALFATAPGDGHATPPSASALTALTGANPIGLLGFLFPPGQSAATDAYVHDIFIRQPNEGVAPAVQIARQTQASATWLLGQDPDGRKLARIKAPTMVAGGDLDQLLPIENEVHIAETIKGASLFRFDDAAHGFLFQHQAEVVSLVQRHFSG